VVDLSDDKSSTKISTKREIAIYNLNILEEIIRKEDDKNKDEISRNQIMEVLANLYIDQGNNLRALQILKEVNKTNQ
jgi:hypothetical protein